MSLISANGVALPTPSSYNVTIQNIQKSDRNAAGTTIIELITVKRVIALGWTFLSGDDYSLILNAIDPVFFDVTYFDPKDNANKTGTFYVSDRQSPLIQFTNGVPSWGNVQFTLTER